MKRYELYFWKPLLIIYVGIPALFILVGLICFGVAMTGRFGTDGPPAWVFVFVIAFGLFNSYMWLRFPYVITIQENGGIEFCSVFRKTAISPWEIKSIQAKPCTLGFVDVVHEGGRVHLLAQIDGFHEFLSTIKAINPNVTIRGC